MGTQLLPYQILFEMCFSSAHVLPAFPVASYFKVLGKILTSAVELGP